MRCIPCRDLELDCGLTALDQSNRSCGHSRGLTGVSAATVIVLQGLVSLITCRREGERRHRMGYTDGVSVCGRGPKRWADGSWVRDRRLRVMCEV